MAYIDKVRLNNLTIKYLLGTITPQEQDELNTILDQDPAMRQRFLQRVDPDNLKTGLERYLAAQKKISVPTRTPFIRRLLPYAAAAAVLAIALTLWLSQRKATPKNQPVQPADPIIAMEHEILPGSNRATLTLGNGTTIDLDAANKGLVSKQGNVDILKTDDGRITYTPGKSTPSAISWNMIATPRSGTYQVTLPDGSKAWLNAASSIRFPTSFSEANRREATISGEVYFEIKPDPAKPFTVSNGTTSVQVLGTEFDIQTYNNEPVSRVTLINGSVMVRVGQHQQRLTPGQQTLLTSEMQLGIVDHPDIDQATAWKNGFFKFKNADIRTIMREIERWYDVDVDYRITDYSMKYGGRISRNLPLSQLLRLLQGNNIHHYKMEGRNLIVLP